MLGDEKVRPMSGVALARRAARLDAALGVTGAAAGAPWRALEWTLPPAAADTWRRSVCRTSLI
jgi:hypothetical protein